MTPSNSRPLASGAGTTTIGRSGSTSPGSASETPRASSASRRSATRSGIAITATVARSVDHRHGVLGHLVDELTGSNAVQVGRVAVGADRPRRRDPRRGARQQPVRQREHGARQAVAQRELGGLRVGGPAEVRRASPPNCRATPDRSPARDRRARSSSAGGARRASMRNCIGERSCASSTTTCSNWRVPPFTSDSASSRRGRSFAVHDSAIARGRSNSSCSAGVEHAVGGAGEHALLREQRADERDRAHGPPTAVDRPCANRRSASSSAPSSCSSKPSGIASRVRVVRVVHERPPEPLALRG